MFFDAYLIQNSIIHIPKPCGNSCNPVRKYPWAIQLGFSHLLIAHFTKKIYQVFKTEQHYFEIVVKLENENFMVNPVRRIVRYIDIGYNIGIEVWKDSSQASADLLEEY